MIDLAAVSLHAHHLHLQNTINQTPPPLFRIVLYCKSPQHPYLAGSTSDFVLTSTSASTSASICSPHPHPPHPHARVRAYAHTHTYAHKARFNHLGATAATATSFSHQVLAPLPCHDDAFQPHQRIHPIHPQFLIHGLLAVLPGPASGYWCTGDMQLPKLPPACCDKIRG